MPRADQLQGLERRYDANGRVVALRAEVRVPGTKKKARGPWRSGRGMLAAARADRARLFASQEALALQAAHPEWPSVSVALADFFALAEAGRPLARGGKPFAPKTLRGYRQDAVNWITPALGEVPVDRLDLDDVQALVDEVEVMRSGQTARKVATVLQTLYRYLLPRGRRAYGLPQGTPPLHDPTHGLELPQGSQPRNVVVTPLEMPSLLEALTPSDRAPFGLAALAGLRAGEMKALQVADVALGLPAYHEGADVEDCAHIIVRAGWDVIEGRRAAKHRRDGEERIVPVFAPLLPLLEDQRRSLGDNVAPDYPFLPGKGAQGSRIGAGLPLDTDQLLYRCRLAWGFTRPEGGHERKLEPGPSAIAPPTFRLHDARHSFASGLILAGFDVATVSEWIGHRQASTTLDRYVKPLRKRGVKPADVRMYLGVP